MHLPTPVTSLAPLPRIAAAVILLAACGSICAGQVNLCATTAKELQDALTAASDGGAHAGNDVAILAGPGTFKTGIATANGPFHFSSTAAAANDLFIEGGFDASCISPSGDPTMTVLDGNSLSGVLELDGANTRIVVSGLTIRNGNSAGNGAGLAVNTNTSSTGSVQIHDTIITNNQTTAQGGGMAVHIGGVHQYAEVYENLLVNNSADGGYGAGFINSNSTGSGNSGVSLFHNTVYGNTTTDADGVGGFGCCGSPTDDSYIADNIFWQNTSDGLFLYGTSANLYSNDYGTLGGTAPINGNYTLTNLSMEPQFRNAAAGNFRLAGNSPLLGYAIDCNAADMDLDGHALPTSYACDSGAYEETIFSDSLEGN